MTTKLLCATDGSEPSASAVTLAAALAKRLQAPLTYITINRVSEADMRKTLYWDERLLGAAEAQVNAVLADALAVARKQGVSEAMAVIANGHDIAVAIVDYAVRNGFDHIVVGSSRPSAAARVLLGSVADAVVRRAPCPVTVAR